VKAERPGRSGPGSAVDLDQLLNRLSLGLDRLLNRLTPGLPPAG
jgi:hypothetical protein